ncbi:MAG TPA: hypothetical protein VMV19_17095 [Xanthobacteraceae bacterium]|nr:hypothetical protein [Xanthobacteraceae bacterium]
MIHNKAGAILLASTLAAAAQSQVTCAHAAGRYDGTWSMVVFTRTGPCDAAYRFSGQIVNGVITYGSLGIDLAGYVGSGGDTYARVSGGGAHAVAYGRMGATRGGGRWRGRTSSGYCTGTWVATRT